MRADFALALTLLIVASLVPVGAERFPIKVYTAADGLANNVVNRVVRDSRGYLWFCTREGLSRFDGYEFTTYGLDHGLPSAVVNDLLETREGTYWIATAAGVVRFDPTGASDLTIASDRPRMFTRYLPSSDPGSHDVTSLLQDRKGGVWAGTSRGVYQVDDHPGNVRLTLLDIGTPAVRGLTQDAFGALWVGATDGIYRYRGDHGVRHYTTRDGLPGDFVQTLFTDREGRIWFGTRQNGLGWLSIAGPEGRPTIGAVYTTRDGLAERDSFVRHVSKHASNVRLHVRGIRLVF